MIEVAYVLRFARLLSGQLKAVPELPVLERVRLVLARPRPGDDVPGIPSLVSAEVRSIDETARPEMLVIHCRAVLPARERGACLEDVALTPWERRWLGAVLVEAERLGWRQVARDAPKAGAPSGKDGASTPSPEDTPVPRRPLLPLDQIRDDVIVQFSGRDDQGGYLVLKAGEELLDEIVEAGAMPPSRGTRGRIVRGRFVVYADQSLRRVPRLDQGDQLGWMNLACPDGFTAPREIIPDGGPQDP